MTFQVGANAGDTINMKVEGYNISVIYGRAITGDTWIGNANKLILTDANGNITIDLDARAGAGDASTMIHIMDMMIADVDATRASLGAIQNRLESSIRNQSNTSANEADARSRIRDADFAEESANLSQQSIIQQAATSMLMQANTRPQLGLSLLR